MLRFTIITHLLVFFMFSITFGQIGDSGSNTAFTKIKVLESLPDPNQTLPHHSQKNSSSGALTDREIYLAANPILKPQFQSQSVLERLSSEDKANAVIQLEIEKDASSSVKQTAGEIEKLWNSGSRDAAIKKLHNLEQILQRNVAIGISWKVPKKSAYLKGADVQIGTRQDITNITIDFHEATGNLFAVLQYSASGSNYWCVNISYDGGATWTESFNYSSGSSTMQDVNAAVVSDYLYIAYIRDADARMRRCFTSNGTVDGVYGFVSVFNDNVTVNEVAVVALYTHSQMYYVALLADNTMRYFYGSDGVNWTGVAPPVQTADHGLDAHNNEFSSNNTFITVSYVATDGRLHCLIRNSGGWTDFDLVDATTNSSDVTSIAAHADTIIVVYEAASDLLYRITYNAGTNWYNATIATGTSFHEPHVAGKKEGGFAVIYQEEAGTFDPMWFRHRGYYTSWSTPEQFNEVDAYTGSRTNIEWIPPVSEPYAHGAIWLTTGAFAYFDRIEDIPVPVPENLMAMDGYDHAIPLYWDAPVGFSPLKTSSASAIGGISKELNVQSNDLNIESVLLSYNVYRSTVSGGPYTLLDNVDRQYYRDLTAANGVTYYYVVEAVFDDATSGYSDEGSATAVSNGNVISSGWTGSVPTLDGTISAGEWVAASTRDIKASGITLPVTLYTMNDGNFLYFALDDPNNTTGETYDEFGIYFDENQDYEWGQTSPAEEGNFWCDYLDGSPGTRFRGIYGWWPANLGLDTPVTAPGVNQGVSFSSGHIQFEVQIDLSTSDLNALPGDEIGVYLFSYDYDTFVLFGIWPTDIATLWSGPFSYGTLSLAEDPLGIDDEKPTIITEYKLLQNYPNPFNPSTTIKYRIANQKPQSTTLQIYNNLGQLVRTLVKAEQGNGEYSVVWDGLDNNSKEVASGIYFYKLQSGEFISTQKLLKLK